MPSNTPVQTQPLDETQLKTNIELPTPEPLTNNAISTKTENIPNISPEFKYNTPNTPSPVIPNKPIIQVPNAIPKIINNTNTEKQNQIKPVQELQQGGYKEMVDKVRTGVRALLSGKL